MLRDMHILECELSFLTGTFLNLTKKALYGRNKLNYTKTSKNNSR